MKLSYASAQMQCATLFLLLSVSRNTWSISANDIDSSLSMEEFHDLDSQCESENEANNPEPGYDVETISEMQQSQNAKPANIINRFSQVITREVMNRFQLKQFRLPTFSFYSPRDKERGKSKVSSIAARDENKVSIVNMNNVKKIGALCSPEITDADAESESEDYASLDDESLVLCELDSAQTTSLDDCRVPDDIMFETSIDEDDEIQAGMIVYVLPSNEILEDPNNLQGEGISDTSISTFREDDGLDMNAQLASPRCIVEMDRRFEANGDVDQYALIRRELHELGNVDVHRKDFAYHPVVLNKPGHYNHQDWYMDRYNGDELETKISPESEQIEVLSTYDPGYFTSEPETDQQVSFRWWSWIDHFNQFFRNENSGSGGVDRAFYDSNAIGPGSNHGEQTAYGENLYEEQGQRAFAGGSHGEIWKARRRCTAKSIGCDDKKEYIVKRLKIELGYSVLEAGLREVYFGELLGRAAESSNLVTHYVDHFFRKGKKGQIELWIVFENAGPSLRSYLYTSVVDADGGFTVFQHSPFWRRLRKGIKENNDVVDRSVDIIRPLQQEVEHKTVNKTSSHDTRRAKHGNASLLEGKLLLKDVMKQILMSVAFLHGHGIVHRDIKPSNIMCKTIPMLDKDALPHRMESVDCIVGDFSSALDEYSKRNLYMATGGPSIAQITEDYAPPEVLLQSQGSSWTPFSIQNPYSYDSWSIGVVALEMLLGTPNVFSIDQRTTVILTHKLKKEGASPDDIQRALFLAALSQFCIYVPSQGKSWPLRYGDPMHDAKVVKDSCTLRDFHNALRARDVLGIGFDKSTDLLLHLIWKLLAFDPSDRLTPSQALLHPYFAEPTSEQEQNDLISDLQILSSTYANSIPFSGFHNALESQLLELNVNLHMSAEVTEFTCPKCGKVYTDYNSCHQHARLRRHALFCAYDRSTLPHCINAHTMLPTHDNYGYCDIQGRRQTIEDFHSVHLYENQFFGIFDGHLGNLASKYAASSFHHIIEEKLSYLDSEITAPDWKNRVQADVEQTFEDIHRGILTAVTSSPGGVMNQSGTTATILYTTDLALVIANVGDSRAVISQWKSDSQGFQTISAVQLTVDHVASSQDEQQLIHERGGSVSTSGGIERVNGILAVSRSLGDVQLAQYLSRTPYVLSLSKIEAHEICGSPTYGTADSQPCFIILASDGLWDVMTNQESVEMVLEALHANRETAFQVAAEWLTQEAYIRGSTDNIGVCVVAVI